MVKHTARKKRVNGKNNAGQDLGFEQKLFAIADKLRGQMDAAEYKHVVLGLIFLKYVSDVFQEHFNKIESALDADSDDRSKYLEKGVFWLPKKARWNYLETASQPESLGILIDKAMIQIEEEKPSLRGVLHKSFGHSSLDHQRLKELIDVIGSIGLGNEDNRSKDILGRVYEYFLGRFASKEGKGGEFYTPRSVVKLLVEMIEPYKGYIYDPCCGSGGMFVQSEKFVEKHGGRKGDLSIYGQESNPTTWKLCKMNLAIRGIEGDIGQQGADTFHHDLHKGLKADFVLANPPFNDSDWGGNRLEDDHRWKYGIPPKTNANFAWVQHIIHHLGSNGTAGFVLSNGSLSTNQQAEGKIRKALIEADLIDCIVALPGQLFYTTQIAACLWFITNNKNGQNHRDRRGQTLFIYAYEFGQMTDRTHCELTDREISKIADTYHSWRNKESFYKDIPGYCKSAMLEEIKEHKMALVPGRYVGFDENLLEMWSVSNLEEEILEVESRLAEVTQSSKTSLSILKELLNG